VERKAKKRETHALGRWRRRADDREETQKNKTGLTANVHCTSLARAASSETREARGMVASASNSPERSSAALTGAKGKAI